MAEKPHNIPLVEIVPFHDLPAVTLHPLKEDKLVHSHLACNPRKKSKRELDHWMKTHKPSYPRVHFLNRECCMTASECMNPSFAFNSAGHKFSSLADVFTLCFLNACHYVHRVLKPLLCKFHSIFFL